jgi:hypothetical protein
MGPPELASSIMVKTIGLENTKDKDSQTINRTPMVFDKH